MTPLANAGVFLVDWGLTALIFILFARLILLRRPLRFFNPLAAFVETVSRPFVTLAQAGDNVPRPQQFYRLALQTWLLVALRLTLIFLLRVGDMPDLLGLLVWTCGEGVQLVLRFYTYVVIVAVVLSWLPHIADATLLEHLVAPLLSRCRLLVPIIAGLDLSPLLLLVVLQLSHILIAEPLTLWGLRYV